MLSFFTYIRNDSVSSIFAVSPATISYKYINYKTNNTSIFKTNLPFFGSQKGFEIYKIFQKYNLQEMFVILLSSMQSLQCKFQIGPISDHYSRQSATYCEISEDDHPWTVSHAPTIFDEL
jgi:hypothetical protein